MDYCTKDNSGAVQIHVIEGNNPVGVSRNVYPLSNTQILGFGTVHDLADITMRFGNSGEKVRQLQSSLAYLGYLDSKYITGAFGNATADAIRSFQQNHGLKSNSIANMSTQLALQEEVEKKQDSDPLTWTVIDEENDE